MAVNSRQQLPGNGNAELRTDGACWSREYNGEEEMSKNTGGPAFPVADGAAHRIAMQTAGDDEAKYIAESAKALSGMTLRDYFAAQALNGLLSNQQCTPFGMSFGADERESLSRNAYRIANAMLRAREDV